MNETTYSVRGQRPSKVGGRWHVTLTVSTSQGDVRFVGAGYTHQEAWDAAHLKADESRITLSDEMHSRIALRKAKHEARRQRER